MLDFPWFPMIFNGNFEEPENFFLGRAIRCFFEIQKIFWGGVQQDRIRYSFLLTSIFF